MGHTTNFRERYEIHCRTNYSRQLHPPTHGSDLEYEWTVLAYPLSSCPVWEQRRYSAWQTSFNASALYTPFSAFNARVALAQNVRMLAAILIPAPTHQTVDGPPAATPNLASYLHAHTSRQTSEHLSLLGTILFVAQ